MIFKGLDMPLTEGLEGVGRPVGRKKSSIILLCSHC